MKTLKHKLALATSLVIFCAGAQGNIAPAGSELPRPLETQNENRTEVGSVNKSILDQSPCAASKRDYSAYFMDLYESKEPLMNECGLGKLIDFNVLELFDPFGSILDSMKGAVCGLVKDIHDPFVTSLNKEISGANAWMRDQERNYSDWVDEAGRNAAGAIYDPTSRNAKVPWFNPTTGEMEEHNVTEMYFNQETNSWEPLGSQYSDVTGIELENRIEETGGTVNTGIEVIGEDNVEVVIPTGPSSDDNWDSVYQLYQ
jgi:hypothetical protein